MNDESVLNEYSQLVNDLVNTKRELSRINAALIEKEHFLSRILEISPSILYIINLKTRKIEYTNRFMPALLGYTEEDLPGTIAIPDSLIHKDDLEVLDRHYAALREAQDTDILEFEFRAAHKSGQTSWMHCRESIFARDELNIPQKAVGVIEDITSRKMREHKLFEESTKDVLTNLLNRRGFFLFFSSLMTRCVAMSQSCALFYMDIDNFKMINDKFGHGEGDEALKALADIMRNTFRTSDLVARLGGDEFVVLMPDVDENTIAIIQKRFQKKIDEFALISLHPWSLSVSVGVAFQKPGQILPVSELLKIADENMYRNKNSIQNTHNQP